MAFLSVLSRTARGVCLLSGAAGAALAQTGKPLPPVKLLPPDGGVTTSAAPQSVPAATGTYAQPQPGTYAQPARTTAAPSVAAPAAGGTFTQPKPGMFTQPSAGMTAAPVSSAAAPAPVDTQPRKVSLFGGSTPAASAAGSPAAPVASAPVEAAVPATMPSSNAVPVPAGVRKSSLPPPRLFGAGGSETMPEARAATPAVAAKAVATRSKVVSVKKVAPKGPALIVQPGKPLLDEYGVQRVDPQGQLMFSEPVKQARDKRGKPLFADGQPVFQTEEDPGYDERGKRVKMARVAGPRTANVNIEHGAFTVDGIVGKVQLNYDIGEMHYLYLYVPDTGVTVVSANPFPGAIVQRGAFRNGMLRVKTEEHELAVSSENPFFGKKPVDAYVMVDRGFLMPGAKFPVFGYGATTRAPYVWPGSKVEEKVAGVSDYAPPVPKNLKPKLLGEGCAPGAKCAKPVAAGALPAAPVPATVPATATATAAVPTTAAAPVASAEPAAATPTAEVPVMAPAADAAPVMAPTTTP